MLIADSQVSNNPQESTSAREFMLDDEPNGVYIEGMKPSAPFYDWLVVGFFVGMGAMLTCLSGCSPAGQGPHSDEELLDPNPAAALTGRCDMDDIFSPGPPELQESVTRAAALWEAAMGRPVCVEDGGLPIELSADVTANTDHQLCGFTWQYWYNGPEQWAWNVSIVIRQLDNSLDCDGYDAVVLHEMGHALGRRKDHTKTGLMSPYSTGEDMVDQQAIDYACRDTDCY